MNKIFLMGRIVNELELKTTPNGISVCTFRIAVDRNYQKKGEEKVADFFNVSCWRGTAEFITKWFGKGRMIMIEGELQTRQYTDKNGNLATWYEIQADNVYFTGEKRDDASQNPTNVLPTGTPANYGAPSKSSPDFAANGSDDYPF